MKKSNSSSQRGGITFVFRVATLKQKELSVDDMQEFHDYLFRRFGLSTRQSAEVITCLDRVVSRASIARAQA